jgi:hypothetical protein
MRKSLGIHYQAFSLSQETDFIFIDIAILPQALSLQKFQSPSTDIHTPHSKMPNQPL